MIEAITSTHDLLERLRRVLADAPGVVIAYLYGSHARGRAKPLSDVDLALLLDRDDEEQRLERTAAITQAVAPARTDVVILNDAPLSYRGAARREGPRLA